MQRFPLDTVNGNNTAPIDPNMQNFVGDPYSNMMQNPSFSLMPSMNPQSYNFSSSPFIPQNTGISSSNQIMGMNINPMNTTPPISSAKNSSSGKSNIPPFTLSKFVILYIRSLVSKLHKQCHFYVRSNHTKS